MKPKRTRQAVSATLKPIGPKCTDCGWWWCICHPDFPGMVQVEGGAKAAAGAPLAGAAAAAAARESAR